MAKKPTKLQRRKESTEGWETCWNLTVAILFLTPRLPDVVIEVRMLEVSVARLSVSGIMSGCHKPGVSWPVCHCWTGAAPG